MSKDTVAIDENEINSQILNITNASDNLRKLFNEIFDLAEDSLAYSNCTALNKWRSNISQLKDDCNNVINNLSSYKSDDEYSGFITLLNEDAGFVTTYWLHLLADGSVKIVYQFEKEKVYSPTYTIYGDYSLLKFNNDDHSSDKEIYLF